MKKRGPEVQEKSGGLAVSLSVASDSRRGERRTEKEYQKRKEKIHRTAEVRS